MEAWHPDLGIRIATSGALRDQGTVPGQDRREPLTATRTDKLRGRAVDALKEAGSTIEAVAKGTLETAGRLTKAALAPALIEVEIGIAFTAKGGVIIAGGEIEASIVVHLSYDLSARKSPDQNSPEQKQP
jgi:hypothetical protein